VVEVGRLSAIEASGALLFCFSLVAKSVLAWSRSWSITVDATLEVDDSGSNSIAASWCACCVATMSICISSGLPSSGGASSVLTSINSSAGSLVSSLVSGNAMACLDFAPGVLRGCPGTGPCCDLPGEACTTFGWTSVSEGGVSGRTMLEVATVMLAGKDRATGETESKAAHRTQTCWLE
jgi:hypothetical protein